MIDFPLRVYISSSWNGDLKAEIEAVKNLIEKELLMHPVYPSLASPLDITSDYFTRLKDCDIIVVLLGSKYSDHVENEFKFALDKEIPAIVFQKECECEEELQKKIETLYRLVTIKPFKTTADLKNDVKASIIDLLGKALRARRKIEKAIKPLIGSEIRTIWPKPTDSEYKGVPRINPFERR